MEDALTTVHDSLPCEWWLCITASAIALRTFIGLPICIYQWRIRAKIFNLQPEIKNEVEKNIIALKLRTNNLENMKILEKMVKTFKNLICIQTERKT